MASHLVGQIQVTTFTSPVAGTSPIDANVVRSNDNTLKTAYDAHDLDATIHVQDSLVASRPVAGTAGRKWLSTDAAGFYLYYDDGTSWNEISYARSASPSFTGAVTITSASANALAVGLAGATNPAFNVDSSTASQAAGLNVVGAVAAGTVAIAVISSGSNASLSINAKGSGTIAIGSVSTGAVTITPATTITGALTQTGLATFNGGATVASGQTLTLTSATVTGLTAASVGTGTFPGAYTVTGAVTLSAALTYGGVALSNAVTGTGNMVLSASPTLTGTIVLTGTTITGTPTWSSTQTMNITGNASGTAATVTGATQASITTAANLVTVGALNSGSITSGFGSINVGSDSITGGVITGTTAVFTGATVAQTLSADSSVEYSVTNVNAGTGAQAKFIASATNVGIQVVGFGSGYTTDGLRIANTSALLSTGGQLSIFTYDANSLVLGTNKTANVTIASGGAITAVGILTLTAATGLVLATTSSPASNGTGTTGSITWDANYFYVCTATNTWERAALTGGY